jgi:hypothetical protein
VSPSPQGKSRGDNVAARDRQFVQGGNEGSLESRPAPTAATRPERGPQATDAQRPVSPSGLAGSKTAPCSAQLELNPEPRCPSCGPLGWTVARYGRVTHKCGCSERTDDFCQTHIHCDEFTDIRNAAWRNSSQLSELPGSTWADIFKPSEAA